MTNDSRSFGPRRPPRRPLPFLLLLSLLAGTLGSGCAVRSVYIKPDFERVERHAVKRLVVAATPIPGLPVRAAELLASMSRRHVNQHKDYLAVDYKVLPAASRWRELCGAAAAGDEADEGKAGGEADEGKAGAAGEGEVQGGEAAGDKAGADGGAAGDKAGADGGAAGDKAGADEGAAGAGEEPAQATGDQAGAPPGGGTPAVGDEPAEPAPAEEGEAEEAEEEAPEVHGVVRVMVASLRRSSGQVSVDMTADLLRCDGPGTLVWKVEIDDTNDSKDDNLTELAGVYRREFGAVADAFAAPFFIVIKAAFESLPSPKLTDEETMEKIELE